MLFGHHKISFTFRNGNSVDDAIDRMRRGDLAVGVFPPIHVLEEDGKYIAIRGNRRLFLHRVLATRKVLSLVFDFCKGGKLYSSPPKTKFLSEQIPE